MELHRRSATFSFVFLAALTLLPSFVAAATFTRPLVPGSSGTDVTALQQILVSKGFLTSAPTGYFGPLTAKSLAKFQTVNGIEALGGVGPKTRTLLNSLSGSVSGSASSGSSSNSNQATIDALLAQVKILQDKIAAILAGNTNPASAVTAGTPATINNYTPLASSGGNSVNSTPSSGGGGGSSNNTSPNYGNGPFSSYFTSGALSIPASGSPSAATQIAVNSDTTVTAAGSNGSDSIKLKGGNSITKSGGGTLDVTALTTTDINPASLTLPAGTAGEGAVQFGVPGTALSFTQPVTISIAVSPSNNGDTLNIYRAESLTGPWLTDGLSPSTCLVANGICQFNTTLASRFVGSRLAPTVTITASPTSVTSGGSTVVTWSSTSATSCTASGSWSGSKATSGSQTFTNLTTSQAYTLTCSGKSKAGSATQSATVTVTGAPADTTAPSAPTSLAGLATSQTQINLTWTASTDNVGVTGYQVFRNGTQVGTPTVTSYSDTGLSASTAYTYTVKATDAAGNLSAVSNSVNVATLAPVPTVTISTNPTSVTSGGSTALTWSSTNASNCTASGAWSGTKATSGSQAFTNLSVNQTYTLQCTGTGGSATQSASVAVTAPVDTTPPNVTITGPVSSLPSGTTQTTLTATTNEAATCRYSTNSTFTFSTGTIFTTTGNTSHSTTISGLTNATSYTYYVKCQDTAGNISGNASVTFAVSAVADTTPPSVTITAPTANLAANTTNTTLSVTTNENATCAQSTNINATFAQMTAFTTTGALSHSTILSGLQNSTSYTYYVKCQDTAGNISGNASVTFAVATPPDTTAPTVPTNLTATAISSSQISLSWTASTDNVGVTGYKIFRAGTQIGTSATNSYSDTGLTASTQYSYTVSANDAAGNNSAQSTSASATTQAVSGGGGSSAEVPGPSLALFNAPFYSCVRSFYVATNGNDANAGTQASPWLTIQHADSASRQAGDCINVAPGTYQPVNPTGANAGGLVTQHGGNAPTPTGYVVYRCQTMDACHILATRAGQLWLIEQPANFVVIDGFEVDGNNALQADGLADSCIVSSWDGSKWSSPVSDSSHHIWILNNIVHHCNLGGINLSNNEWQYIIHNTVYHNAWTSGYEGSGIGLVVDNCIEAGNPSCFANTTAAKGSGTYVPSGMDLTYDAPYHIVISENNVYDNSEAHDGITCGAHTDGNGIILDTWFNEPTLVDGTPPQGTAYPYQSLVLGNVSYKNGGRGIHVFASSNVTVANNTVYGNGMDTCINSYGLADLSNAGGTNNVWVNNVSQSVLSPANPTGGQFAGNNNVPLIAGNGRGVTSVNNTYIHNITFGGIGTAVFTYGTTGLGLFDNDVGYFSTANNKVNTNPLFANPSSNVFTLSTGSPAIGYSQQESYVPSWMTDAGAFQTGSGSTADTAAPSTPTSLAASAVSSSAINLTWTASTDNVGVTGYKIFRGGTQIGTSATNSYSDTGLTASTAYSYTVSAYDAAGNNSAQSSSAPATTQAGAADTTPPVITITAPFGQLAAGTTQTTLSVTTNENATCAYSSTAGTAFASMTTFTTTGGTSHSTTISSLTNGSSYTTYVKCKDTAGNVSIDSSTSYSVASSGGGSTLGNGLVGYWSLDTSDVTGTTVTDLSGSGNTGTTIGSPLSVAGKTGQALSLIAANQGINFGNRASLDITGPFSISFWVFPTTTPAAVGYTFFQKNPTYLHAGFDSWYGYYSAAPICEINSNISVQSSAIMNIGQWNHIVCLYDGSNLKIYLNGTQTGSVANATNSADTATGNLTFGNGNAAGNDTGLPAGPLDEIRVYNRALTPTEISQMASAGN